MADLFQLVPMGHVGFSIYHRASEKMVKGEFLNYQGTVEFNPEIKRLIKVRSIIQIASLETSDEKRDKFIKNDKAFFDQSSFGEMLFEIPHPVKLVENRGVETTAYITIKGIKRPVLLALTYLGKKTHGYSFKMTGRLSRESFGLTWNEKLASGVMALSDEVHLYGEAIIEKMTEKHSTPW